MNTEQIINALCVECEDCPEYHKKEHKCIGLYYCPNRDAADLIEDQAAEIARLMNGIKEIGAICAKRHDEIDRLTALAALRECAERRENKPLTCTGCYGKQKQPRNRAYWACQACTRNSNIKDHYEPGRSDT